MTAQVFTSSVRYVNQLLFPRELYGIRVLVELKKGDKADAIKGIKDVLSQLED